MKIEEVLKKHSKNMMSISGIVGIGQGICDAKSCIVIYVAKNTPGLADQITEKLEGYEVKIKETGVFEAFPEDKY